MTNKLQEAFKQGFEKEAENNKEIVYTSGSILGGGLGTALGYKGGKRIEGRLNNALIDDMIHPYAERVSNELGGELWNKYNMRKHFQPTDHVQDIARKIRQIPKWSAGAGGLLGAGLGLAAGAAANEYG